MFGFHATKTISEKIDPLSVTTIDKLDWCLKYGAFPFNYFVFRIESDAIKTFGITKGCAVIAIRGEIPKNRDIYICIVNNRFVIRYIMLDDNIYLDSDDENDEIIYVKDVPDFEIVGRVAYKINYAPTSKIKITEVPRPASLV